MKLFKKYYIAVLLIICLGSVAVYGTYAMFTLTVSTDDIVSMDTSITNYTFDINSTQSITVGQKSKMRFNAIIKNNLEGSIAYGLYYVVKEPSNGALPEGATVNYVTGRSGVNGPTEILAKDKTATVPIYVYNPGDTAITIEVGVAMGYEHNGVENIIYGSGQNKITSSKTEEQAGTSGCTSTVVTECKDECYYSRENDRLVEYCTCKSGEVIELTPRISSEMLAYLRTLNNKYPASASAKTTSTSQAGSTEFGVYSASDDYGTSYYVRGGNATADTVPNWVKFAGLYWRILRINGDGSIRMIYNGTTTDMTGTGTQYGTSNFNRSYNPNAYVGYTYGTPGSSDFASEHYGTTSSTIKGVVDTFYNKKINQNIAGGKGKYADYISNTGFCGDRTVVTTDSNYTGNGVGTSITAYAPRNRIGRSMSSSDYTLKYLSTQTIQFTCNEKDRYTTSVSREDTTTKGNGVLSNPLGLITSDEALASGAFGGGTQNTHWLYTGQAYWTMSPSYFTGNAAVVWYVCYDGNLGGHYVSSDYGVRPVVSLKSDVELTGSGLSTDPFIVTGTNDSV